MTGKEMSELLNSGEYTEFAYQVACLYGGLDLTKISTTIAEFHEAIKGAES